MNFLDLIRENDSNPASGCPQLEFTVTATKMVDSVSWTGEADIEISGCPQTLIRPFETKRATR